jgi:hypothetical protein
MKCAGGSARIRLKNVSGGWTKRRVRYWSSAKGESSASDGSSASSALISDAKTSRPFRSV